MEIVLYPTDTLYGLGVDATNEEAIQSLFLLKGRDEKKPLSIMVSDSDMIERYAEVTPLARTLIETFLPGKLTIVLDTKDLPITLTAGTGTVGVRIPDHKKALALVCERSVPITATSANVSGMETKHSVPEILAQFGEKANMITRIIDDGILPPSAPSTVVDARGDTPIILREGAITGEDILQKVEGRR